MALRSAKTIQFWFEFASTYSYPAAQRIEGVASAAGVAVEWKPFLLGPVFQRQGWNDSPFNLYPVKGRYMWRDLERVCELEGIEFRRPSRFPRNGLLAARVACVGVRESWGPDFVRGVYRANFAEDREISDPGVVRAVLDSLGVAAEEVLASAQSDDNKQRLRAQTDQAIEKGLFGAPSFVVGEELFWGNDRLEQAIAFAKER